MAFLRTTALGPLALTVHGHLPRGVRKLEVNTPNLLGRFVATLPTHDAESCVNALKHAATLYRELREQLADGSVEFRIDAEREALAFLDEIHASIATDRASRVEP